MRLKITHVTKYTYDQPVHYALQQLRLVPRTGHGQQVLEWSTSITGGTRQVTFEDQFVNHTELVKVDPGVQEIEIVSEGLVETVDRQGVLGAHQGCAPLWLFKEPTAFTAPGPQIRQFARKLKAGLSDSEALDQAHKLSDAIAGAVRYQAGTTNSTTTAEAALTAGQGVCQDHAHIMISVARLMGYAARYVSGYLKMDGQDEQEASHAWCEIWVDGLGWVGFDVSNEVCPDDRYVRVAVGRDYRDAAPIHGIRQGSGQESLHVALQIQQ
ncbi:transglutaminase family protein [Tropicimonas sp. IMCC34043]|uniref:transglutaminase family protein n=1 Tax=Tropicimonas sp. IMCC34043 TaxID=2248760 RepID=UPI000E2735C1|nr:transglutaminase family protein [Tropicimonas sp. IMCC34043]